MWGADLVQEEEGPTIIGLQELPQGVCVCVCIFSDLDVVERLCSFVGQGVCSMEECPAWYDGSAGKVQVIV